ncbi:MAG: hypothetical protein E7386_05540 [Ruminococcaceae bacterium]|nr:hypothetical protein [Oscillospiraceae bacterium]
MKWEELPSSYEWDRRLAYFLDPANQKDISKEDLQEALAILAAKYCDAFYDMRFLECFIEEQLGTEKLESAIEANVDSDSVTDRVEVLMDEKTVEGRMQISHGFVTRIAEEFDDLNDGNF